MSRILNYSFFAFAWLLASLPMRVLYLISDGLYPLVYYVFGYRKKVVFENLTNAFPEKDAKEIEQIAKKFYLHFCDILVEDVKLFHISPKEMKKRLKFRDPAPVWAEFERHKSILAVIAHYNNWEWGISLGMQGPHHFVSIYKPLNNKYFDKRMIKLRTQFGGEVVPMSRVPRVLTGYIQANKPIIMNFIADQSPMEHEVQYWTTFLNQDTPIYLGIEKLARKTRQPVYFAKVYKVKRGYYEVEVEKLCDDCSELPEHELTERHVRALEKMIRQNPEYWLWSHRRWKIKRTVKA
jgi:Kdo2-lipid IVA lauroyltransferase/acyltransferase